MLSYPVLQKLGHLWSWLPSFETLSQEWCLKNHFYWFFYPWVRHHLNSHLCLSLSSFTSFAHWFSKELFDSDINRGRVNTQWSCHQAWKLRKKGRELYGDGKKRATGFWILEGWNMGYRPKLCQGSVINVFQSLFQYSRISTGCENSCFWPVSLSWRVCYFSLSQTGASQVCEGKGASDFIIRSRHRGWSTSLLY